MKFFLSLLLVCAECRPDTPTLQQAIGGKFKEAIDKAMKRKYGDSFGGTEDDICAQNCVQVPPQGFGQLMAPFREAKLEHAQSLYNKETLTKICDFVRTTATCLRACPETQRHSFLSDVFAPIKYMCEDSHFVDYVDCYKEDWTEEHDRCFSEQQCGSKKTDFNTKYSIHSATLKKNKPQMEDMVGSLCTLIDCGLKCSNAKRIEKCTADANTVLIGFWKKMGESMKTIRYLSPHDFVIDIPESCGQIGKS